MKTSILTACIAINLISLPVFAQTGGNVADEKVAGQSPPTEEKKELAGLVCYQGGKKVIDEWGITEFRYGTGMVYGQMPDGSRLAVTGVDGHSGLACKIVEYEK